MKRIFRLSIKRKLVLMATATSAISLLLVAALGYVYSRIDYRNELTRELVSNARFLAFNSVAALEFDTPEEAEEGLRALQARPSIVGAAIFDPEGQVFATYSRGDRVALDFAGLPRDPGAHYTGDRVLVVEHITSDEHVVGTICLVSDRQELNARLQRYVMVGGVVFFGVALVSILISFRLQRFISEPVRRLAETARTISDQKDYSLRTKVRSGDELGALAGQFNQMLDEIQRQDLALRESHDRLEQRVQERTQALSVAKEEAEAAARAKGDFLATMSHELRTPLNGISGMMELLSESELTDEQRDRVRVVNYSAESLVTIVNDILDYSKIEAGRLELEPRPFDLEELIHSVGELLSINAAEKGVDLFAHFSPHAPRRVIGDDGRIRQVLLNVAGNAVKFTQHGRIFIKVDWEEGAAESLLYTITVEDTGIGIPEDKVDTIFESFTQADASTTRQFGGTGLGLAIVRRLVEIMGGTIAIESELGQGTRVIFSLRLARDPDAVTSDPPKRPTILLIDDDPVTRGIYTETLERWGFTVKATALDTKSLHQLATADVQDDGVAVIVFNADSTLDAKKAVQAIRDTKSLADLPMVSLGSPAHPRDRELLEEAGSTAYLETYMTPSRIFDAIVGLFPAEVETARRASESAPAFAEETGAAEPKNDHRILLVEDNIINQKVANGFLKRLGLEADVVGDGQQAVDRIREKKYDLIFMDMQMPVMDGLTATAELRQLPNGVHVPVIAMTANAMTEDRDRCLAAGMDDYLAKPLQGKLLQRMIVKYLGKSAANSSRSAHFLVVAANNKEAQRISKTLLTRWPGARVQAAHSAMAACVHIGSRLPNCVLVAATFPDLDIQALDGFLRTEERYRSVRLVVWRDEGDHGDDAESPVPVITGRAELPKLAHLLTAPRHTGSGAH